MRVERIDVVAFGPFRDRVIELAPGMNVIYGPNEAGKSALHAALVTGLCGVRRARGKTRDEIAFEERHRPWKGAGWKVRVRVQLADGRRVELVQDLDDKAACAAHDADLGRDVAAEIQSNDWTPDATRWLGIDRRAFLAVAGVRQAELLALRGEADGLLEFVQRAVTHAGADATAAEAMLRIEAYRAEHVGSRTAPHSTKPWRQAQRRVEAARDEWETARAEQKAHAALLVREEDLLDDFERASRDVRVARAALAAADAAEGRRVVGRIRELDARADSGTRHGL